MGSGKFLRAASVPLNEVDWGQVGFISHPGSTGASHLTMVRGVFKAGMGHNFHRHPRQEEMIVVISGQIEQWLDREKMVLGPGDAVFIPPNTVHASFNVGGDGAELLAIFGPSIGETGFETVEVADEEPWKTIRG